MTTSITTQYNARRLSRELGYGIAALVLCHVWVMVMHYEYQELPWLLRQLFDLDEEQSLGTWFSAVILLFPGYLLLQYARDEQVVEARWRRYWQVLGAGFCFLSLDEVAGLHETLNTAIEMSWTVPGAIIVGIVGIAYIPFLRHLPTRTRRLFLLAAVIYVGGAVGIERATDWYADEYLLDTLEYNLTTALEEAMEMSGVVLFIYAVLHHFSRDSTKDASQEVSEQSVSSNAVSGNGRAVMEPRV